MDKTSENVLKRARKSKGITQEKAAEMSGYSVDAIQAWEAGTRRASVEVLDMLALCYDAPWMAAMYLRELSQGSIGQMVPDVSPGRPLAEATMALLDKILAFGESHADRRLISMAADGRIDEQERDEYDAIMADLEEICRAAVDLKFAKEG